MYRYWVKDFVHNQITTAFRYTQTLKRDSTEPIQWIFDTTFGALREQLWKKKEIISFAWSMDCNYWCTFVERQIFNSVSCDVEFSTCRILPPFHGIEAGFIPFNNVQHLERQNKRLIKQFILAPTGLEITRLNFCDFYKSCSLPRSRSVSRHATISWRDTERLRGRLQTLNWKAT